MATFLEGDTQPPALTLRNALKAVEVVRHWKELGRWFNVPTSTWDEIERKHASEEERKSAVLDYWLLTDPAPSWRTLIVALDKIPDHQAHQAADRIRGWAEPVADPTLTLCNITKTVGTIPEERWSDLATCLGVPWAKLNEIQSPKYPSDNQRMEVALEYWRRTVPGVSWESLAEALHEGEWDTALQEAKNYFQKQGDPTLISGSLYSALKDMRDRWPTLAGRIGIPQSAQKEIQQRYSSNAQRLRASLQYWVDNHPAPSWQRIAGALYRLGTSLSEPYGTRAHTVLRKVQELYITASEESKRLFEDAMTYGHVESATAKVLITGIAGSGKTCSRHVIFGEKPPRLRCSTPLAQRPIRVIRVDPLSSEWTRIGPERMKKLLAEVIKAHALGVIQTPRTTFLITTENPETAAEHLTTPHKETTHPPSASTTQARPESTEANPMATDEAPAKMQGGASLQSSATEEELLKLIGQSTTSKPLLKLQWVHFVDSGGQPQFHEVLPIFLRGTSLCLFVFKLSEKLRECPVVEYYNEEGECIGKPYKAVHTNEQILRHCIRTMQSHRSRGGKGKAPKILIIGTHKDKEGGCEGETREDKNRKLREMLLPTFQDEVVYYKGFQELIFPLNAQSPGPEEMKIAEEIRRVIMTKCLPETHQIPISWYALELLLRELADSCGRQILSTKECFAAAQRLKFEEKSFKAALNHLDKLNLIFYYDQVLPDVVFCDIMVLLDKVTELVKYIHQLKEGPAQHVAITGDVQKFHDYGLVTAEFLNRFTNHYVLPVFSPQELIKLFRDLLIFANFSHTEFFMPCLLEIMESADVDSHRVSPTAAAAPFVLHFPSGLRHGMFCSLISFLLSPENEFPCHWELVKDGATPTCLYRNCVKFRIPDHPGTVVVIESFEFFEIHINVPARLSARICPKLCPVIADAVLRGLEKAADTLNYDDCNPKKAFICPCGQGDPHPATVGADQSYWVCSKDPDECDDLQPNQLLWLPSKDEPMQMVKLDLSNAIEVCDILRECGFSFGDWDLLARRLCRDIDVRSLSQSQYNHERCLHETIRQWLHKDLEASWRKLADAVGRISEYGHVVTEEILKKSGSN